MEKSTDKYYEIERGDAEAAQKKILTAAIAENDMESCLTMEDINALGRLLAYQQKVGGTDGQYEAVVDFLWMSCRVSYSLKIRLLELAESKSTEARLVGRARYINGDVQEFTDAEEFLRCMREELPYSSTTGFKAEVLTDEQAAADDILFDFWGEENPKTIDDYRRESK